MCAFVIRLFLCILKISIVVLPSDIKIRKSTDLSCLSRMIFTRIICKDTIPIEMLQKMDMTILLIGYSAKMYNEEYARRIGYRLIEVK